MLAALAPRPGAAQPASTEPSPALLAALRAGGHVLYFRHADTDHRQTDARPLAFEDCATQRNLTDRGRANSRAIGEAFRALGIPIGPVLASPLCRTVETAMLAFGVAERALAVRDAGPEPAGSPARFAALRALLETAPPSATNTAIVGHGYPFYALVGEAAVVRPRAGGFDVITRVGVAQWRALADASR